MESQKRFWRVQRGLSCGLPFVKATPKSLLKRLFLLIALQQQFQISFDDPSMFYYCN